MLESSAIVVSGSESAARVPREIRPLRHFVLIALLAGFGLLGWVLALTDLREVWAYLGVLGIGGVAVVLAVYWLGFVGEALSWLFAMGHIPLTPTWLYRLWKVLMVGSAIERVTPFAGLGGEPVKAVVLRQYYGVSYRDATASLIVTRLTDVFSLIVFISAGVVLLVRADVLPPALERTVLWSLGAFALVGVSFFIAQQARLVSHLRAGFARGDSALAARFAAALDGLRGVEDRLVDFYRNQPVRFVLSVAATLCEWLAGAAAVWIALSLLGHPVSFGDAVVIEAFVLLVVSALFFVPGDIGTQEGAVVLIVDALTGSPSLGLALAALRRARDLVWVAWGLAIGSVSYLGRAELLDAARAAEREASGT